MIFSLSPYIFFCIWKVYTCHSCVRQTPDFVMLHPQIHSSHQIGNRYEPGLLFTPLQKEVGGMNLDWLQPKLQLMLLCWTVSFSTTQYTQWFGFFLPFLLLFSLIVATAGMILAPIMANAIKVIFEDWGIIHLKTSSQETAWMVMIPLLHWLQRKLVTYKTICTFNDHTHH